MNKLTREQVINVVGRIDDLKIAEIIGTGATVAELTEAKSWITQDDFIGPELQRPLTGRVARLYEILRADEQEWEEN